MDRDVRARADVLATMRWVGLGDRVEDAVLMLPDPVDLVRDSAILAELGRTFDTIIDRLGGSAW